MGLPQLLHQGGHVQMVGHGFHNQLDAVGVINGDLSIHVGQLLRRGKGIEVGLQHRNAGLQRTAAQVNQVVGWFDAVGQQQASQRGAIGSGHGGGNQNIVAVAGGDQQGAGAQYVDHIAQRAGAHGNAHNPAGVEFAGVQNLGIQGAGDIQGTRADQLGGPGNGTQQRTVIQFQLAEIFALGGRGNFTHRRDAGMARAAAGFVNHTTEQIGLGSAKDTQLDFQLGLDLLDGAVTAAGNQQNFSIQGLGNFGVQFGGVRFAAVRYQAFNKHHVAVAAGNGMQGDGVFQHPV